MKRVINLSGWCVALAALCSSAVAGAADGFAQHFALQFDGAAAYCSVPLSAAVYAASQRSDLGDLRVFNGAGEAVPYSLDTPSEPPRAASTLRAVRWLPLEFAAADAPGMPLHIAISTDGSLRATAAPPPPAEHDADVIDGGRAALAGRLGALLVHVRDDNYQGRVHVDVSDDLRHWQAAGDAQLLKVHYNGSTLSQDRIELGGTHARYLRLHWLDGAPHVDSIDAAVFAADVDLVKHADVRREWRDAIVARPGLRAGEYFFSTGRSYPVDRLRIDLPQPDTVAPVLVYSRPDLNAPWREVARATLFRLHNGAAEQSNAPLEVKPDHDRLWRVVVDTREGGVGVGASALSVAAGWRPATLSFAVRGSGPFTLAVGNAGKTSAALSREALLKGERAVPVAAHLDGAAGLARKANASVAANALGVAGAPGVVGASDEGNTSDVGNGSAMAGSTTARASRAAGAAGPRSDVSRRNLLWGALALGVGLLALLVGWLLRSARRRTSGAKDAAENVTGKAAAIADGSVAEPDTDPSSSQRT